MEFPLTKESNTPRYEPAGKRWPSSCLPWRLSQEEGILLWEKSVAGCCLGFSEIYKKGINVSP